MGSIFIIIVSCLVLVGLGYLTGRMDEQSKIIDREIKQANESLDNINQELDELYRQGDNNE